jgi:hypothetical protein
MKHMNSKTRPFPDRPRVKLRDFLGKSLKPDRDGLIFNLLDFRAPEQLPKIVIGRAAKGVWRDAGRVFILKLI